GTDNVVVTVKRQNTPPSVGDVNVSAVVSTPVTVTINASDADTCELTFSVIQPPASGSLGTLQNLTCAAGTPNGDSARIVYTPSATPGTYSFTYKANDGGVDSNPGTVTITVTPPPNIITIAATTATSTESPVANGLFTVTRAGDTSASLTVNYAA